MQNIMQTVTWAQGQTRDRGVVRGQCYPLWHRGTLIRNRLPIIDHSWIQKVWSVSIMDITFDISVGETFWDVFTVHAQKSSGVSFFISVEAGESIPPLDLSALSPEYDYKTERETGYCPTAFWEVLPELAEHLAEFCLLETTWHWYMTQDHL